MSIESLSPRETTVFFRLANGERLTDIASDLQLSIKTVSTYRTRLLKKLDLVSNAEIAALAVTMEGGSCKECGGTGIMEKGNDYDAGIPCHACRASGNASGEVWP